MESKEYTQEEIEEGKSAALLAYVPFVCFVPLLKWKDNRFAYDHAKQGLALFIVEVLAVVLLIPGLAALVFKLALTLMIVLAVIGIVYVLQDKAWKLPLVGDWVDKTVEDKTKDL